MCDTRSGMRGSGRASRQPCPGKGARIRRAYGARIRVLILSVLLILIAVPEGTAQRIHIDVRARGFTKLKVAMPAFSGSQDLAPAIWEHCARDLALSGVFELLAPQTYIDQGPLASVTPGTLKDWTLIGADYVITGSVARLGDKVQLRAEIVELASGRRLVNALYASPSGTPYRIAHALVDTFLDQSLGIPGMFSSKIVFSHRQAGKKQLMTAWCDGADPRTIGGLGDLVVNPAWSPEADALAFVSYWRNNPDLYLMDLKTLKVELLSEQKGINITPAFDPSGKRLAYTLSTDGNPEIYVLDLATRQRRRITQNWGIDTSPSFSSDGTQLAFCSSRGGTPQIYLVELASGKVKRLTFQGNYNTEPVYSPKGDLIAFTHLAGDRRYHVAVMRTDGSSLTVLPGTGKGDESPSFSPDGRLIVFAASDGQLYVTDLVGSASPVRITAGEGEYAEPSWSGVIRQGG